MRAMMIATIVASVTMSACAQVLLKFGMSRSPVQAAMARGSVTQILWCVATSPGVIFGLLSFALSVLLWLFVLSRVDVSYAYPFVALGMIITVLSGWLILGEALSLLRIAGVVVIVLGVCLVALSSATTG